MLGNNIPTQAALLPLPVQAVFSAGERRVSLEPGLSVSGTVGAWGKCRGLLSVLESQRHGPSAWGSVE